MGRRRLRVIVEADGAARGNPGPAGYAAVVREAATGEVLLEVAESIGVATNNVAEYSALLAGLRAAAELGAVEVEVRMDSKLVVEQMSGRWQIKHPRLRALAAEAATLAQRFDTVRFSWVPRAQNVRADALANAAIDGRPLPDQLSDSPPPPPQLADAASRTAMPAAPSWMPPAAGTATRLVLVRHGETELTAQRRYSGRGDLPLSAHGQEQAVATARRLATVVGAGAPIVSSPLSRAVGTAEAIATAVGSAPVEIEPDLIECDFGEWEGLTFTEVKRRWPDRLEAWLGSSGVSPPGGESFDSVAVRVRAAVERIRAAHAGEPIIVVSHVTPIKLILRDALGGGDDFLRRVFLDPAGISIVDMWIDGSVSVRSVNETAHLPPR